MENTQNIFHSGRLEKLGALFLLVATIFVGIQAVGAFAKLLEGDNDVPQNTITVEGVGTVTAVPDIATITYTFSEQGDTASQAQEEAAQKSNVALAVLQGEFDIEDADIKQLRTIFHLAITADNLVSTVSAQSMNSALLAIR